MDTFKSWFSEGPDNRRGTSRIADYVTGYGRTFVWNKCVCLVRKVVNRRACSVVDRRRVIWLPRTVWFSVCGMCLRRRKRYVIRPRASILQKVRATLRNVLGEVRFKRRAFTWQRKTENGPRKTQIRCSKRVSKCTIDEGLRRSFFADFTIFHYVIRAHNTCTLRSTPKSSITYNMMRSSAVWPINKQTSSTITFDVTNTRTMCSYCLRNNTHKKTHKDRFYFPTTLANII